MNNCDKYLELISDYIDTKEMDESLKEHLESCPSCRAELLSIDKMVQELNNLPALELPAGFHEQAMKNIRGSRSSDILPKNIDFKKYTSIAAAIVVCFVLFGSALSFASSALAGREPSLDNRHASTLVAPASMEIDIAAGGARVPAVEFSGDIPARVDIAPVSEVAPVPVTGHPVHSHHQSIISISYDLTLTVADMDQAVMLLRMSGYEIERSSVSDNWSSITLNVPVHEFENAKWFAESLGEVNFQQESRFDLTRETNDLAIRYLARLEESTRLSSLISVAGRAEDILTVQGRISQIEHERARLRGSYNQNLAFGHNASIFISLNPEGTPIYNFQPTFSERVSEAFTGSVNFTTAMFEGTLIFAASSVAPIVLIGIIGGIGYLLYKKVAGKRAGGQKHE